MNAPTKYEIMSVEALNTLKDIIKKFDLDKAEPKQKLQGHDTKWEVDGRVFSTRHKNWFLVECKRKGKKHSFTQQEVGGIVFEKNDLGASGVFHSHTFTL